MLWVGHVVCPVHEIWICLQGVSLAFSLTPDLMVDDPLIDHEHRQLIALVNNLDTLMRAHAPFMARLNALAELNNWTKTHFEHEEQIMRDIAFDHYIAHKREHEKLLSQLKERTQQVMLSQHEPKLLETYSFFMDWLVCHIKHFDKQLAYAIKKTDEKNK